MLICLEKILKEGAGGDKNKLVDFYLLTILTDQSDISEVFVGPQLFKSRSDIVPEVIPLQTELIVGTLHLQKSVVLAAQDSSIPLLQSDLIDL